MKGALVILLSAVVVGLAYAGDTCTLNDGSRVQMNGPNIRMRSPCKFNFIQQDCGAYKVRLTPGLMYVRGYYSIDTLWFSAIKIADTTKQWLGRTTNKKAAMAIIRGADNHSPVAPRSDSTLNTADVFTVTNTTSSIVIAEKNGDFRIELWPYDFKGNKQTDSEMTFTCNSATVNLPVPYPDQYCGNSSGKSLKERAMTLWGRNSMGTVKTKDMELSFLYDMFNDNTIEQINENCIAATTAFTTTCTSEAAKKEALVECHQILTDDKRASCVQDHACEPIEIFAACVQFVCSDYKDKDACEKVGSGIDLCRKIGVNVTAEMKAPTANGPGCYRDLLTCEDNPHCPSE